MPYEPQKSRRSGTGGGNVCLNLEQNEYLSVEGAAAPCWETALPDVISAVLVRLSEPIPRGARSVHLPISSRPAAASP